MRITKSGGFRELVKKAKRQGFVVEPCSSGHIRFVPPSLGTRIVIVSGTPKSDSLDKVKKQLRIAGLNEL